MGDVLGALVGVLVRVLVGVLVGWRVGWRVGLLVGVLVGVFVVSRRRRRGAEVLLCKRRLPNRDVVVSDSDLSSPKVGASLGATETVFSA